MIKKLLLQMLPPERASREAVEMIRADRLKREDRKELNSCYWGPNRHQCVYVWDTVTYFEYGIQAVIEAEVCDHLLRLSIYSRYALHRGDLQPEVVVYIDKRKKRWRNYFPQTGKWTEAMIDRVSDVKTDRVTNRYRFVMYDKIACTGTQKAIGYLESDIEMEPKDTSYDAVLRWQRWIRAERNERKKEVQVDKWNKAMELIPTIPDDFDARSFPNMTRGGPGSENTGISVHTAERSGNPMTREYITRNASALFVTPNWSSHIGEGRRCSEGRSIQGSSRDMVTALSCAGSTC